MQPSVAIVILNYNTRALLGQFLAGVVASSYASKTVWVVDNASTDDSVDYVKTNFAGRVELLVSPQNYGYAGGYNWALDQIDSEYYVLLNSDVRVHPDWLNSLVDMAVRDPKIGAIQPKILDEKNSRKFEYAGASGGFLDKWGYPFCRGRIFDTLEADQGHYDEPMRVFWATGACMFLRAEAFRSAGKLDADFFAHMEEIDLCWRLQRRGYTVMVEPKSVVFHIGGGTLAEGSDQKYFLNFRNNLYLLAKNHASDFWFLIVLWRMVLDGISAIKFVASGKYSVFFAIIKAHRAFWKNSGTVLKKRKDVKTLGDTPVALYPKSIVWQYFVRGKKRFIEL